MERPTKSSILTIFAFLLMCGATLGTMLFITRQLTVSGAYWLVPIFGALGGVVGGLLRSENAFELCSYEECKEKLERNGGIVIPLKYGKIHLGTLGEVVIGMGGATGAVYLFGGTLRFDECDLKIYVLLV